MKIKVNKAQCALCKDIIESTHRHDFTACSCFDGVKGIAVDGGLDYLRRVGCAQYVIELSEYEE